MWAPWDLPGRFDFWSNRAFYWNTGLLKESKTGHSNLVALQYLYFITITVIIFIIIAVGLSCSF